jgi:hypothetical protein
MVRGLDIFKKYFEGFESNYVIIGGTACDIILDEAGFTARATRDIDIILIVEALDRRFVERFWQFISDGKYRQRERSDGKREYYRFMKPEAEEFPYQLELFAKKPDVIKITDDAHLTPIPAEDDLSSLSAILLNDEYYNYILKESVSENGLHRAKTEALICLKAKAFLEISERIKNGSKEDDKHLRKHKNDVFRLAALLRPDDIFELPTSIKFDLSLFAESIKDDLPEKELFREMGNLEPEKVFHRILNSFIPFQN